MTPSTINFLVEVLGPEWKSERFLPHAAGNK